MMFNSPLAFCDVVAQYVALDQTQRECALEQRCKAQLKCPLKSLFLPSGGACSARPPETAGEGGARRGGRRRQLAG